MGELVLKFNRLKALEIVRQQLALDMNCNAQDFLADGVRFCEGKLNEGRRMFERQAPYLEIATMGKGIVISSDASILEKIKHVIENKSRDDLFFAPFVYGHSLYYIPDYKVIKGLPCPEGFTFHVKEGEEIHALYEVPGFNNAIQYDKNHPRPDILVTYVMKDNEIVAMAGASVDSKTMWQIGIDVMPAFRNAGLATCLVSNLAVMIIERGIVPYYGAASSNIASQAVAYRSGFAPTWMCTYKNILDGKSPYGSGAFEVMI
jgi:hypothetical protein